jgi:putative endonuclease
MGEIDIVARDGRTLVFVEVKARESLEFGGGGEAVTPWKRRRIARVAAEYMLLHERTECPCRFDVVSIAVGAGVPSVEIYQNAFDAC